MRPSLSEAVILARVVERIAPRFGFHVALTGGCLYKDGERKDIDLLFYPHENDATNTDKKGLLVALAEEAYFGVATDYGRVVKASIPPGIAVDLIFPGIGFEGNYSDAVEPSNFDLTGLVA